MMIHINANWGGHFITTIRQIKRRGTYSETDERERRETESKSKTVPNGWCKMMGSTDENG